MATPVVTTPGSSIAQQIAAVVPAGADVLKAFSTSAGWDVALSANRH